MELRESYAMFGLKFLIEKTEACGGETGELQNAISVIAFCDETSDCNAVAQVLI